MCHEDQLTLSFGVIKAFLDADLLPRVITGTSAGGLVAALLCTRTNDELKQLIVPRLADKITACSDSFTVWFKRFLKTGARFSSVEWAEKVSVVASSVEADSRLCSSQEVLLLSRKRMSEREGR